MAEIVLPKNYLSRKPSLNSTEVAGFTGIVGFEDLYVIFQASMFCVDTFYTLFNNQGFPVIVETRDQKDGFFVQIVGKPKDDPNLVGVLSAGGLALLKSRSGLYSPDPENISFSTWLRFGSKWPLAMGKDLYLNHESPTEILLSLYTMAEWKTLRQKTK